MHLRTVVALLLVVLGLGGLLLWTLQDERGQALESDAPLVPGLDLESIVALRVDNLERGLQLKVERGADRVWRLTDPLEYPADAAVMELLLDALVLNRAQAWEGHGSLEELALDPPRVVVEVEQREAGGSGLRRVEVGAVDLDQSHVFARVDGRVVRTLRNLDSALERDLPDWRDRMLLGVSPGSIVELHRRGAAPPIPGAEPEDLTLDALGEGGWKATSPFVAALAPEAMGALLTSLAYLRVAGFEDDAPGPLELYGLEPPDVRIELTSVQGETFALRLALVPGSDRLRCVREGSPHVYTLARENVAWLLAPVGMLVDRELVRATRERIDVVRLAADGRETTLSREGARWSLRSAGGAGPALQGERADAERVSDLLGRIEAARVLELLPGVDFPAQPAATGIWVESGGVLLGGALGPAASSPRGTEGLLFQRAGDTLVGLVDPALLELARTDPRSLRSEVLHRVRELDVVQAQVAAPWASARRVWSRNDAGRWTPEGSQAEALDFARLVDRLLTGRAVRLLDPGEEPAGTRALQVALVDKTGQALASYALELLEGQAEDPRAARVLYTSAERRAIVDGQLYFPLAALLELP